MVVQQPCIRSHYHLIPALPVVRPSNYLLKLCWTVISYQKFFLKKHHLTQIEIMGFLSQIMEFKYVVLPGIDSHLRLGMIRDD